MKINLIGVYLITDWIIIAYRIFFCFYWEIM